MQGMPKAFSVPWAYVWKCEPSEQEAFGSFVGYNRAKMSLSVQEQNPSFLIKFRNKAATSVGESCSLPLLPPPPPVKVLTGC